MRNKIFLLLSALCLVSAGIHLSGIFGWIDESPPIRHLIFLWLSLWGSYLLQDRPVFLVYLFPILLIQQYYGHGTRAYRWWTEEGRIDWVSLLVLLILPVAYYFICLDFMDKKYRRNE